jgi:Ca-activated chloride channel family protein
MNFYELLGIPRSATTAEIRRAYRHAAQRLHPDKNIRPGDTELFLQVSNAYKTLSDPKKRAEYDANLESVETEGSGNGAMLRVRITHGRESLLVHHEAQMHYMLLEILPPKQINLQRAPINLCLLIDKSTSMRGERMDQVRYATLSILQSLIPADMVSVVAFSDRAEVVVSTKQAHEVNAARARLSQIRPDGGTEIGRALQTGLAQVLSRSTEISVNHLILITDGRTYGDEEVCRDLATQAAENRITINTIGIGFNWNDDLLDEIASISGGHSAYMDSPHTLGDLSKQILESLSQVAALQVQLDAELTDQARLHSVFRVRPDPLPLKGAFPMTLGHLPSKDKISLLLEWKLDPIEDTGELTLADFRISSGGLGTGKTRAPMFVSASIPIHDQSDRSPPPEEVLSAIGAITLYRMQERARREAQSGQTKNAIQRLERFAAQLSQMGEQTLANIALTEARNLKQTNQLSEQGEKALKYGARARMQLPPPENL